MIPFWIVAKESTPDIKATVWHDTFEAASAEAQRLARKHQVPFLVLRAVGRWVPAETPLVWEEAETDG